MPAALPVVDYSAVFWINAAPLLAAGIDSNNFALTIAAFAYGSKPDNKVVASIPEPSSFLLVAVGIGCLAVILRRKAYQP